MLFHNQAITTDLFSHTGGEVMMSDLRLRSNKFGGRPGVAGAELQNLDDMDQLSESLILMSRVRFRI